MTSNTNTITFAFGIRMAMLLALIDLKNTTLIHSSQIYLNLVGPALVMTGLLYFCSTYVLKAFFIMFEQTSVLISPRYIKRGF